MKRILVNQWYELMENVNINVKIHMNIKNGILIVSSKLVYKCIKLART